MLYEEYKTRIFKFHKTSKTRLTARESTWLEFKESFNWGDKSNYARIMASFANREGGFIVFGVRDNPRELVGLSGSAFKQLDEAIIAQYLNSVLSPEVFFQKIVDEVYGKPVGIIAVRQVALKPVMPTRSDSDIKEGEIYYRYGARSEKIHYPELRNIIDEVRQHERKAWLEHFERISVIGPKNAAVLDTIGGTVSGAGGTLVIDEALVPKLKFIREGQFNESGQPTLKLIGDVKPMPVVGQKIGAFRFTDDPNAPVVRMEEQTILQKYPLDYGKLIQQLRDRYTNFKTTQKFHEIKSRLKKDKQFCVVRYLDPQNPRSAHKDYYSRKIIYQFDRHYTKRQ